MTNDRTIKTIVSFKSPQQREAKAIDVHVSHLRQIISGSRHSELCRLWNHSVANLMLHGDNTLAVGYHQCSNLLCGGLLDHVFDCSDDFFIGEVRALAFPRHHTGAAGEAMQTVL